MDNKQLSGVVFSQGWLGSQIENLKAENEAQQVIFAQMADVWKSIDAALDMLIRENGEALTKLESIKRIVG